MRRVLIPTDFSENANNALEFAVELYKYEECTFYLLNTIYDSDNVLHSSIYEVYKERSLKELNAIVAKMKEKHPETPLYFEKISTVNLLNEEIEAIVKEKHIDIIIMGTKGASGVQEFLFGSYTVSAMKVAECPLLAIPEGFTFKSPKDIVLATDYDVDFENYHMEVLKGIATKHKAKLHALHVKTDAKPMTFAQQQSKKALEQNFEGMQMSFEEVDDASVQKAIFSYHKIHDIGLLVMIKNKHSFWERLFSGSVIDSIGYKITFPFLVLPSKSVIKETA
ncbi:Nucleotide-binding universal stress protein, UspA family [Pustulibacterium marinum]|uniref:Nucleotide-binding universal stress protein, UspA family n=1 Tax=Pustulibacterium marinum TaxID=1224947 RepID=A0A1I7H3A2_9FLAO|nr:universal stress protein [Pustulibacterium marinum]SFU55173.1 Nucleotide-binding universal stress protein, UspA family [Pustulibacterium marinum]